MYLIIVLQYGVKIFVITSYKDTCYIEILPKSQKSKRGNLYTSCFMGVFVVMFRCLILDIELCHCFQKKLLSATVQGGLIVPCLSVKDTAVV